MLQALIFDVDGTLADTEATHRAAFNLAFAEVGLDWVWDEPTYVSLLEVSGGKERILQHWRQVQPDLLDIDGTEVQDTVARIHELKSAFYEQAVHDGAVALRPGVLPLIAGAHALGLRMAIATTTSPMNVAALLRTAFGPEGARMLPIVEDASTAPLKKPHPQAYQQALRRLHLPAQACLAFEDSGNGLQAARGAGLATVVTPTRFTAHHDFNGALRVLPNLQAVTVDLLREWHERAGSQAPTTAR